jgi:hypothetical protein
MHLLRKPIYFILSALFILIFFFFLHNDDAKNNTANIDTLIYSSAIILPSDYETLARYQARRVLTRWFVLAYQAHLKSWTDEEQAQQYYLQQKERFDTTPFEAVADEIGLELARLQAIKNTYYQAEHWRRLLETNEHKLNTAIPQADYHANTWLSAYDDDIDPDVLRILLANPVQKWHINELPSGDILLSFVEQRDLDHSRLGLIRRLNENSLFAIWQTAEQP